MKKWLYILLSCLCLFACVGCNKEKEAWTLSDEYLTLTVSAQSHDYDETYRYFDVSLKVEIKKDFTLTVTRPLVDENNAIIGNKDELLRWGFASSAKLLPKMGVVGAEEVTYTYKKGEKITYEKRISHWDEDETKLSMPLTLSGYLLLPNQHVKSFTTNVTIKFTR